jgi:hypothetical protein
MSVKDEVDGMFQYIFLHNSFPVPWVHSFGHVLSKKHELARAFGPEKPALSYLFSFWRFT